MDTAPRSPEVDATAALPVIDASTPRTPRSWHLDAATREAGRRGIARARAALAASRSHREQRDADGPGEDGRRTAA